MSTLYPFRFQPILRRYVWGGRRLGTVLGKPIGEQDDCAESWEVVDHGGDQSVVSAGLLAGITLHELVQQHGQALLGQHHPQSQFPLLFKFLDAQRKLSVQVHPDDARAAQLDPPDLGKTEAWVILATEPESEIYVGLKRGFDRPALAREVARGTSELCLHHFRPKVGDCIFLPAGVVHAMGAGLLAAEIQQASDTTYRLYDWNLMGTDGKPRTLHIEQALEAIDYEYGPVDAQVPQPTNDPHVSRLVSCDKFVLDRWDILQPHMAGGDQRCHIISVLQGSVSVDGDAVESPLAIGGTVVLPAEASAVSVRPQGRAVMLDMYLP